MANVIVFKEDGDIVQYIESVHTPDFENRVDVLINPTLPEGFTVDEYKVIDGSIVKKTNLEIQADNTLKKYEERQNILDQVYLSPKDILNIVLLLLPEFGVVTLDKLPQIKKRFREEAEKRLNA